MKMFKIAVTAGVPATLSVCTTLRAACGEGQQAMHGEALYFGIDKLGGVVSSEAWRQFLDTVVTPCLPEGWTILTATGQWRSAAGLIVREASCVLNLIHPGQPTVDEAIREIVADYKYRFPQEAVMGVHE